MARRARRSEGKIAAAAAAAMIVAVAGLAAQSFRSRVDLVQVTVTVTDADGRLVTGLTRDDFQVFEDGVEYPVTQFSDERVPVSLGVLLDASDSMRGQAAIDARGALERFLVELLEPVDETFVATFNHQPRLVARWTRPPSALRNVLEGLRPSGGTALYDSLAGVSELFTRRRHARAALLMVSDGADTASDRTLHRALDAVRRTDVFVYAIAIDAADARASTRVNPEALREITSLSGGTTEVVRSSADLGPATARIADELNKQYTLGYSPSREPDGAWRGIRVRMRPDGHFARARRGYYAEPSEP